MKTKLKKMETKKKVKMIAFWDIARVVSMKYTDVSEVRLQDHSVQYPSNQSSLHPSLWEPKISLKKGEFAANMFNKYK